MNRREMLAAAAASVACPWAPLAHAQAKPVELEFPSWQIEEPGAAEYWSELVKAFETRHPNVRVKKQQVPFREYVDKLTVRFAGNNPPDIVHLPTRNFLAFASQGWLSALDADLKDTDVKATYMKLADEMSYEGKTYGVLMMGYGMMFYYNEKMLADAKLGVPKTSDELLAAIAATTDANAGRYGWGAPTNEHPNVFVEISTWVTGEGASLFKGNGYNFTDPAVVRAVDRFRAAVKNAPKGTSSEQARQLFLDGKVAMLRDGPWVAASLKKAPDATRPHLRMGMMPFARIPGARATACTFPRRSMPRSAGSSGSSSA
jgi:multiple sugar transport system substrate-binding protein